MTVNLQKYIQKQKDLIDKEKYLEGLKIGNDPGSEYVRNWINRNAARFRKNYALGDLKDAISDLKEVKCIMKQYLDKINSLNGIVEQCEDKILEGIALLESEKENHENGGK